VNPAICGMLFAQGEAMISRGKQLADATKAAAAILAILTAAALAGTKVLHLFGVSLDAFMVAGGGVLAWMGFSMLSGDTSASGSSTAPSGSQPSLTPLILFAASPGTITGVITISAAHTRLHLPSLSHEQETGALPPRPGDPRLNPYCGVTATAKASVYTTSTLSPSLSSSR
jgi:multiple antibiotic resistance protein